MRTLDYKLIHALDVVITEQSFDKAAEKLSITQSAISQRIKQLELLVAQPVLIRSQPPQTTEIGQKLLRHFRQVRQLEYDLVEQIMPDKVDAILSVSIAINADTLASWFIPAMAPLLKRHPIELNLQIENESTTQKLLQRGEVFAAVSTYSQSFSGCKVSPIGQVIYILCATDDFKDKYFPNELTATALKNAPGVDFDRRDTMHSCYIEENYGLKVGDYPCHTVRSSEAFVQLAIEGVAYCLLPHTQANEYLASGQLVDLAPQQHLSQMLYWHSWLFERGIHKEISQTVINYGRDVLLAVTAD